MKVRSYGFTIIGVTILIMLIIDFLFSSSYIGIYKKHNLGNNDAGTNIYYFDSKIYDKPDILYVEDSKTNNTIQRGFSLINKKGESDPLIMILESKEVVEIIASLGSWKLIDTHSLSFASIMTGDNKNYSICKNITGCNDVRNYNKSSKHITINYKQDNAIQHNNLTGSITISLK